MMPYGDPTKERFSPFLASSQIFDAASSVWMPQLVAYCHFLDVGVKKSNTMVEKGGHTKRRLCLTKRETLFSHDLTRGRFSAGVKYSTVGFNVKFWRRRQRNDYTSLAWKPQEESQASIRSDSLRIRSTKIQMAQPLPANSKFWRVKITQAAEYHFWTGWLRMLHWIAIYGTCPLKVRFLRINVTGTRLPEGWHLLSLLST